MNEDLEHLRLLSIFHYLVAGLAGEADHVSFSSPASPLLVKEPKSRVGTCAPIGRPGT